MLATTHPPSTMAGPAKSRRVPAELRQRAERSCDRCKSRKHKCSTAAGEQKCRHCLKYGYDCVVTKPRKQRLPRTAEGYDARFSVLETLVKRLVPEVDTSNLESMQEMARSLGAAVPGSDGKAGDAASGVGGEDKDGGPKEDEQLVKDLQGQDQYIGRSSSYFFQMKLRALVGRNGDGSIGQMRLFGPNPAGCRPRAGSSSSDADGPIDFHSVASATTPSSAASPAAEAPQADPTIAFKLVRVFFEKVNVDFPVLHEASFLERLDDWRKDPSALDQAWLCTFLCVLILARRLCDVSLPDDQEERWWGRVRDMLSRVIFTSSLTSIQALMLAALHLHNNNSRDACWTLTGAASRIGFAIGLHKDGLDNGVTPLTREIRKKVWWTLYAFEQVQVSSHDRPSSMDSIKHLGSPSREAMLDLGTHNPPEYSTWANRLVTLLGAACRIIPVAPKEGDANLPSPASGFLRELTRWRESLPKHLTTDLIDSMPPSFQRPLILLHVQYHYIRSLVSRNALLARFGAVSREGGKKLPDALLSMSEVCAESGRLPCELLLKLEDLDKFNAVTWFDAYYLYSSTLVLALSIMCDIGQDSAAESRRLLCRCTELSKKHLANPLVPGTMHRWLTVVVELNTMITDFTSRRNEEKDPSPSGDGVGSATPDYSTSMMPFLEMSRPSQRGPMSAANDGESQAGMAPAGMGPFTLDQSLSSIDVDMVGLLRTWPENNFDYFPFREPHEAYAWTDGY